MAIIFAAFAGGIWLLCRLGNPNLKLWKLRNFLGGAAFISGLLAGSMAAAQPTVGAALAMGGFGWITAFVVFGLPAAAIYYLVKLRKLPH